MATEYAAPFAGSVIATSQQFRDRNKMLGPDGIDADPTSTAGLVSDGGAGASVNIQNMTALVQGAMYQLTAGPLNLPVAANGGGSNRFDRVVLTYDAAATPGIRARIVQGTPGAGLPALTFNATGIWDMPLAQYEKTPAGTIINMIDCRRFIHPGMRASVYANFGPTVEQIYPAGSARRGMRLCYRNTDEVWQFDGTTWVFVEPGSQCPPVTSFSETDQNTTSTTPQAGSPIVSATFIAPPTGKVFVHIQGAMEGTSPASAYISFEVRVTDAAGAVVLATADDRAIGQQESFWSQSGATFLVTGLVPRVQYYARTMHYSSAAGSDATIFRRRITVQPSLT